MTFGFSLEVTGDLKKEMSVQCELGWSGFMKMREEEETVNMSNFFQQLCCKGEQQNEAVWVEESGSQKEI